MTNYCLLCRKRVDKNDPSSWKQVRGWVGGPRKDSMRLREDTGKYAHDECVAKVQSGQAVDQPELWDSAKVPDFPCDKRFLLDPELEDLLGND